MNSLAFQRPIGCMAGLSGSRLFNRQTVFRNGKLPLTLAPRVARHRQHQGRSAPPLTVAFVVPPALVKVAQKLATRAIPGRLLLLEAARRGAWRFSVPLTAILLVYSAIVTVQLLGAKKKQEDGPDAPEDGVYSMMQNTEFVDSPAALSSTKSGPLSRGKAVAVTTKQQEQAIPAEQRCSLCKGHGTITWEAKFVHEGDPCPLCLGTGRRQQGKKHVFGFL